MNLPSPADLIETFGLLPDWEARYAYLIDLGRALPDMDESLKTDAVLVPGCTSRVWLVAEKRESIRNADCPSSPSPFQGEGRVGDGAGPSTPTFHFHIASDAAIVKGLCAVVMVFVQDRSADDIRAVDMTTVFEKLHLSGNLSPNRRNGFFAMIARIRQLVR